MQIKHLQRLRYSKQLRELSAETGFSRNQLIQPLFIVEGLSHDEEIPSLTDNKRLTADSSIRQIESDLETGINNFIIFFVPAKKTARDFNNSFSSTVLTTIKKKFSSDAYLWVDTCLCSKTSSGHCCLFTDNNEIDFDGTHKELSNFAVSCAQAGADGIAPSDMIDGRVSALRAALDKAGKPMTPILSYSTKFSSSFYGPFRDAADSAPQFGDRKQYQLDVRNKSAAIGASVRCAEEGADMLMVKPGMTSIDLITPIREATGLQVGAYQVSGEYGGLALLAREGLMNFDAALSETWHVFRRAGASFIITYGARRAKNLGF